VDGFQAQVGGRGLRTHSEDRVGEIEEGVGALAEAGVE